MIKLPDYINSIASAIFRKDYDYTSKNSFVIYSLPVGDLDESITVEVTVKIIKKEG